MGPDSFITRPAASPLPAYARVAPPGAATSVARDPGMVGETLRLRFAEAVGDVLRAETPQGMSLWLSGAGRWAGALSPGDLLMVRVLATAPRLEVEVVHPPAPAAPAAGPSPWEGDADPLPRALRWDQAAAQAMARNGPPDTALLAASWQALLRREAHALREAVAHAPADLPLLPGPGAEKHWAWPVLAWAALPLLLRVFDVADDPAADAGTPDRPRPRGRGRRTVLCLDLRWAHWGRVLVQLHALQPGALALRLHAEDAQRLPLLRALVPRIAAALAATGLRLVRCQVTAGAIPPHGHPSGPAWPPRWQDAMSLTSDVFRAAAEAVTVLAEPPGALAA
ncbi:hypothetical protein M5C99_03485 [Acidovorax sp. NCPPB 2350]|nr:hypothetical protein M5C99_03485 [Acidovorax sp. NCPPB 2350]